MRCKCALLMEPARNPYCCSCLICRDKRPGLCGLAACSLSTEVALELLLLQEHIRQAPPPWSCCARRLNAVPFLRASKASDYGQGPHMRKCTLRGMCCVYRVIKFI